MDKNSGQFGKTVSREVELKLTRKPVCIFRLPQAKMSDAVWVEVQRFGDKFYYVRTQEERDQMDSCRYLTNFLNECTDRDVDYLIEGVRRLAQSWVENRKIAKDMESSEFEAAWETIRKEGFWHAFQTQKSLAEQARKLGLDQDVQKAEKTEKKLRNVFRKAIEVGQLDKY